MSKGQHGNREAKKPKKAPEVKPSPTDAVPAPLAAADRLKKKR